MIVIIILTTLRALKKKNEERKFKDWGNRRHDWPTIEFFGG